MITAGAGGRCERLSAQDGQRDHANRRLVRRARPLDGGKQELRGGDRSTRGRRPAGHRLPVLYRSVQPGVPHPDDDQLENATATQEHSVFKRQCLQLLF